MTRTSDLCQKHQGLWSSMPRLLTGKDNLVLPPNPSTIARTSGVGIVPTTSAGLPLLGRAGVEGWSQPSQYSGQKGGLRVL